MQSGTDSVSARDYNLTTTCFILYKRVFIHEWIEPAQYRLILLNPILNNKAKSKVEIGPNGK